MSTITQYIPHITHAPLVLFQPYSPDRSSILDPRNSSSSNLTATTSSTSLSTPSSHTAGKKPVQPISKPLQWSPRKQGATSSTATRHDVSSSSPRRRQALLEAAATSARRAKRQATVKPASHVHRTMRSDLPDRCYRCSGT